MRPSFDHVNKEQQQRKFIQPEQAKSKGQLLTKKFISEEQQDLNQRLIDFENEKAIKPAIQHNLYFPSVLKDAVQGSELKIQTAKEYYKEVIP